MPKAAVTGKTGLHHPSPRKRVTQVVMGLLCYQTHNASQPPLPSKTRSKVCRAPLCALSRATPNQPLAAACHGRAVCGTDMSRNVGDVSSIAGDSLADGLSEAAISPRAVQAGQGPAGGSALEVVGEQPNEAEESAAEESAAEQEKAEGDAGAQEGEEGGSQGESEQAAGGAKAGADAQPESPRGGGGSPMSAARRGQMLGDYLAHANNRRHAGRFAFWLVASKPPTMPLLASGTSSHLWHCGRGDDFGKLHLGLLGLGEQHFFVICYVKLGFSWVSWARARTWLLVVRAGDAGAAVDGLF
jgi:hypothetical protein